MNTKSKKQKNTTMYLIEKRNDDVSMDDPRDDHLMREVAHLVDTSQSIMTKRLVPYHKQRNKYRRTNNNDNELIEEEIPVTSVLHKKKVQNDSGICSDIKTSKQNIWYDLREGNNISSVETSSTEDRARDQQNDRLSRDELTSSYFLRMKDCTQQQQRKHNPSKAQKRSEGKEKNHVSKAIRLRFSSLLLPIIFVISIIQMAISKKYMKIPVLMRTDDQIVMESSSVNLIPTKKFIRKKRKISKPKSSDPHHCCVDCEEDEICGGLWKADRYPPKTANVPDPGGDIYIVISHCKTDLHWVSNFTKGYTDRIASIDIITKCGASVKGAPAKATIQKMRNVGRCDHTYAYYITTLLDERMEEYGNHPEDAIVIFLKDNMSNDSNHQGEGWNDMGLMVELASSSNSFACGNNNSDSDDELSYSYSAYHNSRVMYSFTIENYERNIKSYSDDSGDFASGKFSNLGEFHSYLENHPLPNLVQVCYGGAFAASAENIKKVDDNVWKRAEAALSRGNNIQEGHYMERLWAAFLSNPLEQYQIEAIENHSHGFDNFFVGALYRNRCTCTDCEEDEICGGLWKADRYPPKPDIYYYDEDDSDSDSDSDSGSGGDIYIVISHCKADLHWVSNFTKGYTDRIASIDIITKCGASVKGAPAKATIQKMRNVGRCDHTYAYYITTLLDERMEEYGNYPKDAIVIFLKDDISQMNNLGIHTYSFTSLIELASSSNGFACHRSPFNFDINYGDYYDGEPEGNDDEPEGNNDEPEGNDEKPEGNDEKPEGNDEEVEDYYEEVEDYYEEPEVQWDCSAYHKSPILQKFGIEKYERNIKSYGDNGDNFASGKFSNLGEFHSYLDNHPLPNLVQVCYGGVFAASVENIKKVDDNVWKRAEAALSRGNNIQEGHYMERLWAAFLSNPLERYQMVSLDKMVRDEDLDQSGPYFGMLCRK